MRKIALSVCGGLAALALGSAWGGQRGDAQRTACAKNLLRLQKSLMVYGNDHDDTFPGTDWNVALTPYLPISGATLRCPALTAGVGYAYNRDLVHRTLISIPSPGRTPAFFDTPSLSPNVVASYPTPAGRHAGDAVVYLSGRVVPEVKPDRPAARSQRDLCLDNLRRVGVATALYASDHDDFLPREKWMDSLTPYTRESQPFRCPAVRADAYGYAFTSSLLGKNTTTVDQPWATILTFDSSNLQRNALGTYGTATANRHLGDNLGYLDGHAAPAP